MKLFSIKILIGLAMAPVFAFAQQEHFHIKGQTNPEYNAKFIKLYYEDNSKKIVDSVEIVNGQFEFEGVLSSPTVGKLGMGAEDKGDRIDLFLSNGTIQVSSTDSIATSRITGTELATEYEHFARTIRSLENIVFDGLLKFKDMPDDDERKTFFTSLMVDLDRYTHHKLAMTHKFVQDNPDSYVSLYLLDKSAYSATPNYETHYPTYEKLTQRLKDIPLGKKLGERLLAAKHTFTGASFLDFISTTPDGKEVSLNEIMQDNDYVLVDFWASWCGPCRKENPFVVKTYSAFKDQGFTVLSVSLDNDHAKWVEAIEKDGMPWYHVSSLQGWQEPAAKLYGVRAIPQNFLIDRSGNIVAVNLRADALYKKIEELVGR